MNGRFSRTADYNRIGKNSHLHALAGMIARTTVLRSARVLR